MRRLMFGFAAGLGLACPIGWSDTAWAIDKPSSQTADVAHEDTGCGNNGTAVTFEDSPSIAVRKAAKEHKLVFVLHVSGLFEDPRQT